MAHADEPLDEETVRRRVSDHWPSGVSRALDRLVADPFSFCGGRFAIAPGVPESLTALILRLADVIGIPRSERSGTRTYAFNQAADGAPRLFGTDARLRHFMILAVHGRMLYADLRKVTGAFRLHDEGRDNAPFGRGGQVRLWETPNGTAVELDESYPPGPPPSTPRRSGRGVSAPARPDDQKA